MTEASLKDYLALMRFDKPIGIWLVFFPAAWGALLAGKTPDMLLLLVLLVGAALTRAAGCIINDLTDRTLDAGVERTRMRPLAAGAVRPYEAVILLAVLLAAALLIALSLPPSVLVVALFAVPMIVAYPWMKRFTFWPQLFLGITFNLGALMGWLATGEKIALPAFLLYAACVFWTLAYDTIYAMQDMADDAKAGIKSTALLLGDRVPAFVTACFIAMQGLLCTAVWLADTGPILISGVAVMAWLMLRQLKRLREKSASPGALFVDNQWLGLAFTLALLTDRLLLV